MKGSMRETDIPRHSSLSQRSRRNRNLGKEVQPTAKLKIDGQTDSLLLSVRILALQSHKEEKEAMKQCNSRPGGERKRKLYRVALNTYGTGRRECSSDYLIEFVCALSDAPWKLRKVVRAAAGSGDTRREDRL